jgi:hypothetical protein
MVKKAIKWIGKPIVKGYDWVRDKVNKAVDKVDHFARDKLGLGRVIDTVKGFKVPVPFLGMEVSPWDAIGMNFKAIQNFRDFLDNPTIANAWRGAAPGLDPGTITTPFVSKIFGSEVGPSGSVQQAPSGIIALPDEVRERARHLPPPIFPDLTQRPISDAIERGIESTVGDALGSIRRPPLQVGRNSGTELMRRPRPNGGIPPVFAPRSFPPQTQRPPQPQPVSFGRTYATS